MEQTEEQENVIELLKTHVHNRNYKQKDALKEYLLKYFNLFSLFDESDNPSYLASYCAQNLCYKFIPQGHFLLHQGDQPNRFYMIFKGKGFVYVQKDLDFIQYCVEKDEKYTQRLLEIEEQLKLYEKQQQMQKSGYFSVTHISEQRLLELNIEKRRIEMDQEQYIKESKQNEFLRSDPTKIDKYFKGNVCMFQKVYVQQPGEHFGEIGIFTKDTRSASILAGEDMYLGYLTSEKFMNIFKDQFNSMNYPLKVLRRLLRKTAKKKIIKLSYDFKPKKYNYGNVIYKEGDDTSQIFLIKHGEVEISQLRDNEDKEKDIQQQKEEKYHKKMKEQNPNYIIPKIIQNSPDKKQNINSKKIPTLPQKQKNSRHKHLITVLNPGSFFGHEEIIQGTKYQYTATALTKLDVYCLPKNVFQSLDKTEIQDILANHAKAQSKLREQLISKTTNIKDKFNTMTDEVVIQQSQNKKNLREYLDEMITNFNEGDQEVKKIFGPSPFQENEKKEYSNIYDKIIDEQKQRFEDHKNQLEKHNFRKVNTDKIDLHIKAKKQIQQDKKKKYLESIQLISKKHENKIDNSDSTNTQVQILNDQNIQERHKDSLFLSNDMTTFKQVRKRIEHQRAKPDTQIHKFIKDQTSIQTLFKNINFNTKSKKNKKNLKQSFERLQNSMQSHQKSYNINTDDSLILEENDNDQENELNNSINTQDYQNNFQSHRQIQSKQNLDDSNYSDKQNQQKSSYYNMYNTEISQINNTSNQNTKSKFGIHQQKYISTQNNNNSITSRPIPKIMEKSEKLNKTNKSYQSMNRSNVHLKQIPVFDDNDNKFFKTKQKQQKKNQNQIISITEHSLDKNRKNKEKLHQIYNNHSIFEPKIQNNSQQFLVSNSKGQSKDQSPITISIKKIQNKLQDQPNYQNYQNLQQNLKNATDTNTFTNINSNSNTNTQNTRTNLQSHRSSAANQPKENFYYSPNQSQKQKKNLKVLQPIAYNSSGDLDLNIINQSHNLASQYNSQTALEYQFSQNKSTFLPHSQSQQQLQSNSDLFYYKNKLQSPGKKRKQQQIQDNLLKQKAHFQKKLSLPALAIKQNNRQFLNEQLFQQQQQPKNQEKFVINGINQSHRILKQPQQSFRSAGELEFQKLNN